MTPLTARPGRRARYTVLTALALAAACVATPLSAQYFGRNNPQYRTFDFQVLRTQHFDVYYYPEAETGARDAARMAERWYQRLSQVFTHQLAERQPLILYASHPDFQQTNILSSPVGEGTGGVTESAKLRIIMPLTQTYAETDHLIGHELVHAFQYDIAGLARSAGSIDAGGRALIQSPLWFVEGMAEYLSLGPVDAHTAMWLRDAALTGQLPSLRQLATDPRIFPYRYGHALWAYITGRWGDAVLGQILRQVGAGATYNLAIERVLNITLDDLSDEWQAAVRRAYLPLLEDHPEARVAASPLITRTTEGGRVNVGPALSPDGSRIAFLSERGHLDIELWLADAETGNTIRRLVRGPALDVHFSSLNFIASAGSFSPDGQTLAFTALRRGHNVIALVDVERARVVREIPVPNLPEVTNPSWSPDGRSIAFSGTQGGITNLYLIDVETSAVRQLTSGRHADVMPAFSPDGRTIAFTTDRGPGTDFVTLETGPYRIAVVDVASGEITLLPGMAGTRNINPVWAPDGASVYFLSDRTGITNIFRLELATGSLHEVTRIFQGISGFTQLSPALTASLRGDRLAFSVFNRNGYDIFRLDGAEQLAGTPVAMQPEETAPTVGAGSPTPPGPARLPPERDEAEPFHRVSAYLADALGGLPSVETAAAWQPEPYRPRLTLDFIGQPMIGFSTGGVGQGGGLYGGIAGVWSDMLARHTLFGVIQAQGRIEELGFQAAYIYRRQRWDYGIMAQRIPHISGQHARGLDEQGFQVEQLVSYRTFDWSLKGMAQLPFSRAQRVEFIAGPRRLARDVLVQELHQLHGFNEERFDVPNINLFEGSAALVYDNALFGFTAPFAGQRYRFEVAPTTGDLSFISALADYRRYFWVRPTTLALRGIHFGRHGLTDEEQEMVGPLYLGQPSLLRGYSFGAVRNRCVEDLRAGIEDGAACAVFEQLFGNQLAVANLEFRFPLIQALLGGGLPIPPVEGFLFYDAGLTWGMEGTRPVFARGIQADPRERGILSSAGVGARINVFGYMIVEIDYVRPLVGDRGWMWQFALQPGF